MGSCVVPLQEEGTNKEIIIQFPTTAAGSQFTQNASYTGFNLLKKIFDCLEIGRARIAASPKLGAEASGYLLYLAFEFNAPSINLIGDNKEYIVKSVQIAACAF